MCREDEKMLKIALKRGEIPTKGSLGLLAFGDLGLKYWRLAKTNHQNKAL